MFISLALYVIFHFGVALFVIMLCKYWTVLFQELELGFCLNLILFKSLFILVFSGL